jgi:hypothetical protein
MFLFFFILVVNEGPLLPYPSAHPGRSPKYPAHHYFAPEYPSVPELLTWPFPSHADISTIDALLRSLRSGLGCGNG